MAAWLAQNGCNVSVVTSFPYYPNWKVQAPYTGKFYRKEVLQDGRLKIYRCPFYVPAQPSGLKRIIHEATFFLSAFFAVTRLIFARKHTRIFCIAPPFHLGFLALYYRFFRGGKINYHIQDMQIEAARDLKVVKAEWVFKILFALERFILKRVDSISSISVGMNRKIGAKTGREILMFPNWVDTDMFCPIDDRTEIKPKWNYSKSDKIVLYSGSIGEKQGLDALIDIAVKCKAYPEIKFIICGTGPYKQKLEEYAKSKQADNIGFMPLQSMEVFNEFLNLADVHLVLQKAEAADLVMPSKLTTILSSGGLAIATSLPGTSLYDVIKQNEMGILIPPENNESLEKAIIEACTGDYTIQKKNAREYAIKYLNKESILNTMMNG